MSGLLKATDEVEKLSQDLDVKNDVIDNIRSLLVKFPDLMVYRPHGSKKYDFVCCSSDVNHYVDSYDVLELNNETWIWPHTVIDGIKVYSNPPSYRVATTNLDGFGLLPETDWENIMTGDNISNSVIRKVRYFLKGKPPINYKD